MHRTIVQGFLFLVLALASNGFAATSNSPSDTRQDGRITQLERKVTDLERKVENAPKGRTTDPYNTAGVGILFGAFCALWAQNSKRSATIWFILGLFFSVITVLVILYKNSQDRFAQAAANAPTQ